MSESESRFAIVERNFGRAIPVHPHVISLVKLDSDSRGNTKRAKSPLISAAGAMGSDGERRETHAVAIVPIMAVRSNQRI